MPEHSSPGGSRFPLGIVVATPGALDLLAGHGVSAATLIDRHVRGDWGDLDDEDRDANDRALLHGGRLLSAYRLSPTDAVWVITEWDRSVTTVLRPEDY